MCLKKVVCLFKKNAGRRLECCLNRARAHHQQGAAISFFCWTLLFAFFVSESRAWARKTNQPLYETPFDIAAGGASLTFAAKEGRLFTNPALLPYGGSFHQWLGSTTTVIVNQESISTLQHLAQGGGSSGSPSSGGGSGDPASSTSPLLEQIFKTPLRMGAAQALSWLTSSFAISGFSRFEADLKALEYGQNGMPQIAFQAESYQGLAVGTALKPPLLPWLSLGLTVKSILASEPMLALELTDSTALENFKDPAYLRSLVTNNTGYGADLGTLFFLQGRHVDWKLAATVSDVGDTKLAGAGNIAALKQVVSAGLGLTFHTGADALHFAADYRDILGAYGEGSFKRWHLGVRFTVRTYVGLAAGYYDGNPSLGAEIDLLLVRLSATMYTRELGDHPGVNPRQIVLLSLSTGF